MLILSINIDIDPAPLTDNEKALSLEDLGLKELLLIGI
jgi:hypothetical protein